MSRWIISTGFVSAASSAASVFAAPGFERATLVAVAALSALLLASFGARSEARVEEAHKRILELDAQLVETTTMADTAHRLATRPVSERRMEEDYELIVKPIDDAVAAGWNAVKRFLTGSDSHADEAS